MTTPLFLNTAKTYEFRLTLEDSLQGMNIVENPGWRVNCPTAKYQENVVCTDCILYYICVIRGKTHIMTYDIYIYMYKTIVCYILY